MAMLACPECSTEVSDKAMSCVKCGVPLRKLKRSFFGKLFKYTFILFNLLMLWWLIAGMWDASEAVEFAGSSAEQAGAAIGTGLGVMMIFGIWVVGDFILGLFVLFTRPKS